MTRYDFRLTIAFREELTDGDSAVRRNAPCSLPFLVFPPSKARAFLRQLAAAAAAASEPDQPQVRQIDTALSRGVSTAFLR